MIKHNLQRTGLALGMLCQVPAAFAAGDNPSVDAYGSLRTQFESVSPDRRTRLDSYTGWRDAYSRLGVKAEYPLRNGLALFGQLEIPVDSANLRIRDPYDQGDATRPDGQKLRLALAGLKGRFGTVTLGQQWMPYYNAIAAPLDMFSTYYSGFATYTASRVAETLAYASPEFKGISLAAAIASSDGNQRSTSRIDDRRWQLSASYASGAARISAGIDDRGDAGFGRNRLYGLSATYQAGNLGLAAKYELFDTGNGQAGSFTSNGNQAINLFGSYVLGKNTFKLMLARVENYGDNIIHLGIDHQFTDALKFFAEYYREAETAAIVRRRGGLNDFDGVISGGQAFALGLRYDF